MADPTPTPTGGGFTLDDLLKEVGTPSAGSKATGTPTKTPTPMPHPFASYSETDLTLLTHAGIITRDQYVDALVSKGRTREAAQNEVALNMSKALTTANRTQIANLKANPPPPPPTATPSPTATPLPTQPTGLAQVEGGITPAFNAAESEFEAYTRDMNNAGGPSGPGFAAQASQRPPGGSASTSGQGGGQGGTGTAPAKKESPVQLVQMEDGSYAWKRLIGRDSEGRNIYEDASRPPVMEGFSPVQGREGQGWIWDGGAGVYRPVVWKNDIERGGERVGDWQIDYDPKKASMQPQTIDRSPIGQALATGKRFDAQGNPLPMQGTQNAAPVEGFRTTGSIGGGETNIFPTSDPNMPMLPGSRLDGTARAVSTMGVPEVNGQQGMAFSGLANGAMQFNAPGMGAGSNANAILAAYGAKIAGAEDQNAALTNARKALEIQTRVAQLEAANMGMYEIQKQIASEQGWNVDNSMFPTSKSSNSSQGAAETREAGGLRAILGRQYMAQQELPNGGRDEAAETLAYAGGGGMRTQGLTALVDVDTGRVRAVMGRKPEMVNVTPMSPVDANDPAQELAMAQQAGIARPEEVLAFGKPGPMMGGLGQPMMQPPPAPMAPPVPMAPSKPTVVPGPYSEQILGGSNTELGQVIMSQAEANALNEQWAAQQLAANQATLQQGVAQVERQDVINNSDVYGAAGLPMPVGPTYLPVTAGSPITAGAGVNLLPQPAHFFDPSLLYGDPWERDTRRGIGRQSARSMGRRGNRAGMFFTGMGHADMDERRPSMMDVFGRGGIRPEMLLARRSA